MHTRIRAVLRRSTLLQRWRFAPYTIAYAVLRAVVPVRPGRVLFLSDSRADFSGNFEELRSELVRQPPTTHVEVIGVFKPSLSSRRPLRDALRLPWLMATAQTIVLDDFYPLVYPSRIRAETRLLQVWHAAGAFKRVGFSRAGLPGGPIPGSIIHRNYTDVTVSADAIRGDYAEAFGVPEERVQALGVPRTDVFFDDEKIRDAASAVRERHGLPAEAKIALYAPTFRGNGQLTATFDYDCLDWNALADRLGPEWVVLVKMHPFVRPLDEARPDARRVIDVTRDREITELLMSADVLVTDYSSTIFEYALLRRPVVFFCPDLEEYTADRDFYYPFPRYAMGPIVRSGEDLATAISSAEPGPAQAEFVERFMSACDGRSAARIVQEVILRPRAAADAARTLAAPATAPAPTRAVGAMRARLAVAAITRLSLAIAYAPMKLLPLQRKVVLISREHHHEPPDFVDIRRALERAEPELRTVVLVRMVPAGIVGKLSYALHMLRQLYHVATARVLVVDTYAIVASVLTHRPELTVIQIWHALGAFKKFGLSILDREEGRDARLAAAMRMHQGYDLVLASADACRPAYAEAFGVPPERVEVAPLPRVDRLRDPDRAAQTRARILRAHPHLRGARVAVFAPTFRMDGTVSVAPLPLVSALRDAGIHTVVKLHPLMATTLPPGVDTAEGFSTQELLYVADHLITDYSSTLFEAAVVGVPTYFLAPDLNEYLESRDFYLDLSRDLPGPVVASIPELVEAIRDRRADAADARAFADTWVEVPELPSHTPCADQIARLVTSTLPRSPSGDASGAVG